MSNYNRKNKKKKSCCFSPGLIIFLVLITATCIFVCTGVISNLKDSVKKQIYPLEYREEILYLADKYEFEPEFICAVIHTESKFDPEAESPVGAKGLMQIMPDTFEWLSNLKGEEHIPENIAVPNVNMEYGVYFLRFLTDRYSDPYTACAAYNAGLTNVDNWLEDSAYSSDGHTLSVIPYEETKNYVERIKDAEVTYYSLYFSE